MQGSKIKITVLKTVEIEEDVVEVVVTMTADEAEIIRNLVGRVGPKQVERILNEYLPIGKYSVDETMPVVYDFYNILLSNSYSKENI